MASNVIEELLIKIGVDSKGLENGIQGAVKKSAFALKSAITTFVAPVMGALLSGAFIKNTYQEVINLDHLSTSLGVNVERLQMWQGAAKDAGSSAEALGGLWQRMNAMMTDAAMNGSGTLYELAEKGVIPALTTIDGKVKDTDTYLLELADTFHKMDAQTASGLGRKMGIRDFNLMNFLQQGSGEINQQLMHIKELGVYTHEDVLIAREFDVALNDVSRVMKMILVPIFRLVTPLIAKLGRALIDIRKHWMVLVPALALVAGMIVKSMIPAFGDLYRVIKPLMSLKLAGALAVLVALGLALEDIYVWINGGESIIGEYLGTWEEFKPTIQPAIDAIEELGRELKSLAPTFEELFKEAKPLFFDLLGVIIDFSVATTKVFLALVQGIIEGFILPIIRAFKAFQNDDIGGLIDAFMDMPGKIFTAMQNAAKVVYEVFIAPLERWFDGLAKKILNFFSIDFAGKTAKLTASGGGTGSFGGNNVTNNVDANITVNGAGNPTLVAKETAGLLTPAYNTGYNK